jgi:hypothetical protein
MRPRSASAMRSSLRRRPHAARDCKRQAARRAGTEQQREGRNAQALRG